MSDRGRGKALNRERTKAREMRLQGIGFQSIADACGVVVSTAWRWTNGMLMVTADEHDGRRRKR